MAKIAGSALFQNLSGKLMNNIFGSAGANQQSPFSRIAGLAGAMRSGYSSGGFQGAGMALLNQFQPLAQQIFQQQIQPMIAQKQAYFSKLMDSSSIARALQDGVSSPDLARAAFQDFSQSAFAQPYIQRVQQMGQNLGGRFDQYRAKLNNQYQGYVRNIGQILNSQRMGIQGELQSNTLGELKQMYPVPMSHNPETENPPLIGGDPRTWSPNKLKTVPRDGGDSMSRNPKRKNRTSHNPVIQAAKMLRNIHEGPGGTYAVKQRVKQMMKSQRKKTSHNPVTTANHAMFGDGW